MGTISVLPIDRLELGFVPRPWPFAEQHRDEIDARFAESQRHKPALWNGQVLMMADSAVAGSVLRGSLFAVDYASFLVWQDWGCPETGARNVFAAGVLQGADGAFLLGVMAPHTANGGMIYFPCGTPDLSDVAGARVDLDGSVRRELAEETGLTPSDYQVGPGWHVVLEGPRIACLKIMRVPGSGIAVRERILGFLAREKEPELAGIHIVRGPQDFAPTMPGWVPAFLEYIWAK